MKNLKTILLFASFLTLGLFFSSCSSNTDNSDKQGKEYTSAYVCPMHCEGSGSDEKGTCPVCGMDYVKNEDHKTDGHSHEEESHEGHNH